uniref:Betaine lipid synthase n=1 Tax=Kwoniella dejecticola CBS 10117 TaxID=1296121 RepID=A0A1A5ZXJ5_9TREE|nr:betaine lipid synthase [Kwoniella dejecticola CBS 10117]OBR82528.1 betaine lipid synthase [Kwoniella dejecticola CBS 10117]
MATKTTTTAIDREHRPRIGKMGSLVLIGAGTTVLTSKTIQMKMEELANHPPSSLKYFLPFLLLPLLLWTRLALPLRFAYNCFVKPFFARSKHVTEQDAHKAKLESFYSGQADLYDSTRSALLKGRENMLQLLAAHLKAQTEPLVRKGSLGPNGDGVGQKKIWVDLGGGTGWNIEKMDEYLPLSYFDAIYLIDLCEPLLEVARARIKARGWKNVHVLCQDASNFVLPEWESGELDPRGSLRAVTMSYSLSMIPPFYQLLDRCDQVLDPQRGLMGVVDFYTSRDGGNKERAIGTASKRVSWFAKWFWECWFSLDGVNLNASRRGEFYKMGTIKVYNGRNNFLDSWFIQIPYYVFIGCSRRRDASTTLQSFTQEAGNQKGLNNAGLLTPVSPFPTPPLSSPEAFNMMETLDLGPSAYKADIMRGNNDQIVMQQTLVDAGAPLSPFHYHLKKAWRVPYLEEKVHEQFRTHIYGWTWEDPAVDVKKLNINKDDHILAITSAGDNVLHYALAASPARIHAVDMNPCQGHILELKLAAIQALDYNDFWLMFGEGRHPEFKKLLTTKLSPYLSSHAYAYWLAHNTQFSRNFYFRGYSGWALRLAQIAFFLSGVSKDVKKICKANTIAEQDAIWKKKIRPVFLGKWMVKLFLGNPMFNWHALGVPQNQMNCFLQDGTVEDYIKATLDPIPKLTTLKDDNYFFLLCLNGRYTRSSCPSFLKPEGFRALKNGKATNSIKSHTDTILNVLRGLPDGSLTKIIVMDSMDWFDPIDPSTPLPSTSTIAPDTLDSTPEASLEHLRSELDYEIIEMLRVLAIGGQAIWRSAAKRPWYIQRFELAGFRVSSIDIRENGQAIDRVNMYASFWKAEKVTGMRG